MKPQHGGMAGHGGGRTRSPFLTSYALTLAFITFVSVLYFKDFSSTLHQPGGVGVRRGGAAVVRGGGVPLHPAAADVPGARPPRHGVPALAVAAARLLAPQL